MLNVLVGIIWKTQLQICFFESVGFATSKNTRQKLVAELFPDNVASNECLEIGFKQVIDPRNCNIEVIYGFRKVNIPNTSFLNKSVAIELVGFPFF